MSNLGLFLTEKNSLKTWEQAGILSREIAPYNLLANYFKKIYFFTDGDEQDLRYQPRLAPNIEVVTRNRKMPFKKYHRLLPLLHWGKIRHCRFIKTNQLKTRAALIAKILNPRAKLIVRTGYLPSLFEKDSQGKTPWKIRLWEKIAFRLADRVIVASEKDKNYLLKTYQLSPPKLRVIPNYIDTDLFQPQPVPQQEEKIIFIGRLHPQKNLPLLIEALSGTTLELDIVGAPRTPEQSALKEKLLQQAQQQKVKINFLGIIPNEQLPSLLNQYPVFVLPSLYEGTPKALLEAMSCGLACVTTKVVGNQEIIDHEQTGLLAEGQADSLRDNLLRLFRDQRLREVLGQKARNFVVQNYSLRSQINKELSIYQALEPHA